MRKSEPIQLELSITDINFLQSKMNELLLEVVKYTLENSSASEVEKLKYLDDIITAVKKSNGV
jgi:hypothetical protein